MLIESILIRKRTELDELDIMLFVPSSEIVLGEIGMEFHLMNSRDLRSASAKLDNSFLLGRLTIFPFSNTFSISPRLKFDMPIAFTFLVFRSFSIAHQVSI